MSDAPEDGHTKPGATPGGAAVSAAASGGESLLGDAVIDPTLGPLKARLEAIVETIQAYATLNFDARAPISQAGDLLDAISAGVNFLGEELAASFAEIEHRVADRTEELTLLTQDLTRQALHDPLTGLPNRALFWDRLTHRLSTRDRREHNCAVLFIDLDDFKEVNDAHGHSVGDELLVAMARRITAHLRTGDTAARFGGDEFVVLLDDVDSEDAAREVANRLVDAIADPLLLSSIAPLKVIVRGSLGIALAGPRLETPDALVTAADIAMYAAKHIGTGRIEVFNAT